MPSKFRVTAVINGERKQFYGKTRREAIKKRDEAISNAESGIVESSITVFDFAQLWLDNKRDTLRPNTVRMYLNALNNHIIPHIGDIPVNKVKYANCIKCLNPDLSKSSNNKTRLTLTQLFDYAILNDLITRNPAFGLTSKGKDAKKVEACTDEQIDMMFQELKDKRCLLFAALGYYTGMRSAEIRGLQWSDIKDDVVTVQRQLIFRDNAVPEISDNLKTKNAYREIPVPAPLANIIKEYRKMYTCNLKYLISNADGSDLTYQGFIRLVEPLKKLGINPHQLRHTYCTKLAENSVDLKLASYLMGHSDISTTANIYQSVSKKMKKKSIDVVNEVFG